MILLESGPIADALGQARKMAPELGRALSAVPPTECGRRADCCALLPQMSLLEAALLVDAAAKLRQDARVQIEVRLVEYFLLNAARIMGCPFLEQGGCLLYERRPFGCRAYGLWSPAEYNRQADGVAAGWRAVQKAWQDLGVTLPRAVTGHRLEYCRLVRPVEGKSIDDRGLKKIGTAIQTLDRKLGPPTRAFTNNFMNDLSFLTAAAVSGPESALRNKAAAVREYLDQGRSPSLDFVLDRTRQKAESDQRPGFGVDTTADLVK